MDMAKDTKIYVDRDEFVSQMIKCLGSEEYKKALECTEANAASAQWGMAFCANYASVHTPYMEVYDHKNTYPCNYCGECSLWLAAFDKDSKIETWEDLLVQCIKRGCDLVGKRVENDA